MVYTVVYHATKVKKSSTSTHPSNLGDSVDAFGRSLVFFADSLKVGILAHFFLKISPGKESWTKWNGWVKWV